MSKSRAAKLVSVFAMALITGFGGSQNAQAEPSLDALKAGFESIQEWQIDKARKIAWSTISQENDIAQLVSEQEARKELQELKKAQTANILNIYK